VKLRDRLLSHDAIGKLAAILSCAGRERSTGMPPRARSWKRQSASILSAAAALQPGTFRDRPREPKP